MRLRITHEITQTFATPSTSAIEVLRMEPRGSRSQYVEEWRLDVSADCRLVPVDDPFGNRTYTFSVDGPLDSLTIVATGIVATEDAAGVVSGVPERMPLALFLRNTDLSRPSPRIHEIAGAVAAKASGDRLSLLHLMMHELHARCPVRPVDAPTRPAAEAALHEALSATELALVHLSCARALGIPARFVSGYVYAAPDSDEDSRTHAWIEAHVEGIGWIGFDAARDTCPTDAYVRVGVGLDSLDAAFIRASEYGAFEKDVTETVTIEPLADF